MHIIFSPAKEMNLNHPIQENWNLSTYSKGIVSRLQTMSETEIEKTLKVKNQLLEKNKEYIEGFDHEISYQALDLYDGLAFRILKSFERDEEASRYLQNHLQIISALYGPIAPETLIKPYRLDFTMPLKVAGKTLKKHAQSYFDDYFEEGEFLINLASNEFSERFTKTRYQWLDFSFYEIKEGKKKQHSTISKKARGAMVAYLAQVQAKDRKDIEGFSWEGYQYQKSESTEHVMVFSKEI